jgi:hypothetical protein
MWADPGTPPKKKKVKIAPLRSAIFSTHIRRPFCAAIISKHRINPPQLGQKRLASPKHKNQTQKENMAIIEKGITRNPARRPAG